MMKLTKVLLTLVVLLVGAGLFFLTGIVNVSEMPQLYVLFPTGASLCGLFLITLIFEKKFAAAATEQSVQSEKGGDAPAKQSADKLVEKRGPVSAHHEPSQA